eukprot:SAG31_NODE_3492_length_4201_cov_3.139444_5_plen_61_part_00
MVKTAAQAASGRMTNLSLHLSRSTVQVVCGASGTAGSAHVVTAEAIAADVVAKSADKASR